MVYIAPPGSMCSWFMFISSLLGHHIQQQDSSITSLQSTEEFIACKCSLPVILQVQKRVLYQADSPRHILDPGLSHDGSDTFFLSVSVHSFFFAPFTSELSQLPKRCMYWKRKKNECEICNTQCLTPVKLRVVSYWDIFFLHFTFLDSFLCKHGREQV